MNYKITYTKKIKICVFALILLFNFTDLDRFTLNFTNLKRFKLI